jgi:transposase-like protein
LSKYSKKQKLLKRAIALYNQDYKLTTISRELGIHVSTLRGWLRAEGYKPKKNPHGANPKLKDKEEPVEEKEELSILEQESAIEDQALAEAERLQSYKDAYKETTSALNPSAARDQIVSDSLDGKIHEGIQNLTIRTWKDLETAHRIKREINGHTKGTQSVSVDVSILHKTKTLDSNPKVIEAETIEDEPSN